VSYLRAYTLGSTLRLAFAIHFRHWITLVLIYSIPFAPAYVLKVILVGTDIKGLLPVAAIIQYLAGVLVTYPLTIAVSEICLGLKPGVARAYRRAFSHPGRLIGTLLLFSVILVLGLAALLVPGFVFAIWYMFIGPVVVIEGLGGRTALRRSRELGRGFYLRNFGILFVIVLIVFALMILLIVLISIAMVMMGTLTESPSPMMELLLEIVGALAAIFTLPIYLVAVVLLYYDMRVRKEDYGAIQLADDIRF
jgi:hypothetical protein